MLRELTSLSTISRSDLKSRGQSVTRTHKAAQQPYHVSDVDDSIILADPIDIVLDPDVGLDEHGHNSNTDADMNLEAGASLEQSYGRHTVKYRQVDGSTDISKGGSLWMMLATGNSRVVVTRPRNQLEIGRAHV